MHSDHTLFRHELDEGHCTLLQMKVQPLKADAQTFILWCSAESDDLDHREILVS